MTIFGTKPKSPPSRAVALDNLRSAITNAINAAAQSGIGSREAADVLDRAADVARQRDAMTRPVV